MTAPHSPTIVGRRPKSEALATTAAAPHRQHHWTTLALLTTAALSFALMQTLLIPALPYFRHEFGVSASWTTWLVTGFLLSSSVSTPILGKLGDAHGKRRLLVASLAVFGVGSLGAAAAPSFEALVLCRVLQGAGAAVFPLSFGIIRDEFPPEKVGVAIGVLSSVFGVGGGLGLVLSGVILELLAWQWLFLCGAVPVLVSVALIARFVPESPIRTPARPDYLGAATLSLALVALLVALSEGASWGWSSPGVLALLAAAGAGFAAWAAVERRVPEPLVDLRTFGRREMAATNASTFLVGFAVTVFFVLLPGFVQIPPAPAGFGLGASPIQAGLYFIPFSLAMIAAGPAAGALGTRYGRASTLRAGAALAGLALASLAVGHGTAWQLCAALAVLGAGMAFSLTAIGALVLDHSASGETGVASAMNTILRTVGGAFGAQLAVAILTAGTPEGSVLPSEHAYVVAFALAAAAACLALLPTLALQPRKRRTRPWRPRAALARA